MRRLDDTPIDPEVAASLDAVDATLAGQPVDPEYADLAELALLLTAERPAMSAAGVRGLDERVARRFAPRPGPKKRRWLSLNSAMAAATALAAVVALVVLLPGGTSSSGPGVRGTPAPDSGALHSASSAGSAKSAPPASAPSTASSSSSSASSSASSGSAAASSAAPGPAPQPPGTGRQIVQGAQLELSAPPNRIDRVAQEAFDVIGAAHGYVDSSTVTQTGGNDGYADLELTVPSSALAQTMTQLSDLEYAQVTSRTDSIQDVTGKYGSIQRQLSDAQALRTSLLKQLANADTTDQVNSLKAQLRDADGSIASAQGALNALTHQISYTQIEVTIGAVATPVAHSSGFTIGKSAHDAGRVLVVSGAVALIVLAALVPAVLIAALAWWLGAAMRRRRREQALDAA
jgi:hypothetical protein